MLLLFGVCVWVGVWGQINDSKLHFLASIINESISLWPQISLGNGGNAFYLWLVDDNLQVEMASRLAHWSGNINYLDRHPPWGVPCVTVSYHNLYCNFLSFFSLWLYLPYFLDIYLRPSTPWGNYSPSWGKYYGDNFGQSNQCIAVCIK